MLFGGIKRLLTSTSNVLASGRFNSIALQENRIRPKEFMRVKLLGTISQDPLTLNEGSKILLVKTVQPDNHYKVHRVLIGNPKILNIIGDNLSVGQRVYISGDLQSRSFEVEQNIRRQSFQIRASELYATKLDITEKERNKFTDVNEISALSFIATDIDHFDNFSSFTICTHHTAKNPIDGQSEKTAFVRVFVHDKDLIEYTKSDLQKGNRVLIFGSLNSKSETNTNGQKKHCGFIEATHIHKIDRISNASENITDEKIENA